MKNIKNKIAGFLLATSNVEKNALSQNGEMLGTDINHSTRHTQGKISDSLINGEITEEVKSLRWRMYKILNESDGLTAHITGYNPDGTPIVTTNNKIDYKALKSIKSDSFDTYPFEMIINNHEIELSVVDSMNNQYLKISDETIENHEDGIDSITIADISGKEYYTSNKTENLISIFSETTRTFNIENYTKKLNIRNISDDEKLLEFCVSIYPYIYNRNSRLFLSELKKTIENPRSSSILDINEVEFITYNSIGVSNNLLYKYIITSFDKIVTFNGHYLIKFKALPIINGENIFLQYKQDDLEKRYINKEKK